MSYAGDFEPLDSTQAVVRSGDMLDPFLAAAIDNHERAVPGEWALSLAFVRGQDHKAIAAACESVNHARYRWAIVSELTDLGYAVRVDAHDHALLLFQARPGDDERESLRDVVFWRVAENPHYRERKRKR